jgi:phosphohistidine phosphatase
MATPTELYLVRHAIAADRGSEWPDDNKRPLTERGINRFKEAVKGLRHLDVQIDEIFTSPLVRARQTADLLAAGIEASPQSSCSTPCAGTYLGVGDDAVGARGETPPGGAGRA